LWCDEKEKRHYHYKTTYWYNVVQHEKILKSPPSDCRGIYWPVTEDERLEYQKKIYLQPEVKKDLDSYNKRNEENEKIHQHYKKILHEIESARKSSKDSLEKERLMEEIKKTWEDLGHSFPIPSLSCGHGGDRKGLGCFHERYEHEDEFPRKCKKCNCKMLIPGFYRYDLDPIKYQTKHIDEKEWIDYDYLC